MPQSIGASSGHTGGGQAAWRAAGIAGHSATATAQVRAGGQGSSGPEKAGMPQSIGASSGHTGGGQAAWRAAGIAGHSATATAQVRAGGQGSSGPEKGACRSQLVPPLDIRVEGKPPGGLLVLL